VNTAYLEAVEQAGMLPLVTAPLANHALADELLGHVNGLLLTGGEDVDPRRYGAERHPATEDPHVERDAWELALVAAARRRGMPVFAICRGMQLLNVALGGTLIQDLPTQRPGEVRHAQATERAERVHAATVDPGSRFGKATGASAIRINSSHHQALDRVAPGLRVVATSEDGIIEGVEAVGDGWWMLGAQWHPEELVDTPEPWDRNLFAAFAVEVRRAAAGTPVIEPRRRAAS
jgi:putative glutamine amidotransferase